MSSANSHVIAMLRAMREKCDRKDRAFTPIVELIDHRIAATEQALEARAEHEPKLTAAKLKHAAAVARTKTAEGLVRLGSEVPKEALARHSEQTVARAAQAGSARQLEEAEGIARELDRAVERHATDPARNAAADSSHQIANLVGAHHSDMHGLLKWGDRHASETVGKLARDSSAQERLWWPFFEARELENMQSPKQREMLVELYRWRRNAVELHRRELENQAATAKAEAAKFETSTAAGA
jgi:hypothetical protein